MSVVFLGRDRNRLNERYKCVRINQNGIGVSEGVELDWYNEKDNKIA